MTSNALRRLRVIMWSAVALIGLGMTWAIYSAPPVQVESGGTLGQGDYQLEATDGALFTPVSLAGAPSVVFFGFTHCPDICPATLAEISRWQDELGGPAHPLRVWMITVDPERDDVKALRDYLSWLPGATGVTGSRAQIDLALRAFGIAARRVDLADGDYAVDHSAPLLLFDAKGRFVEAYALRDGEAALARLREMLAAA